MVMTICERLALLQDAHMKLLTGESVASVSHEGRTVMYRATDIERLENAIARFTILCEKEQGVTKPTRFAVGTGGGAG